MRKVVELTEKNLKFLGGFAPLAFALNSSWRLGPAMHLLTKIDLGTPLTGGEVEGPAGIGGKAEDQAAIGGGREGLAAIECEGKAPWRLEMGRKTRVGISGLSSVTKCHKMSQDVTCHKIS